MAGYGVSDFFKKRSLFWSENFKNFVSGFRLYIKKKKFFFLGGGGGGGGSGGGGVMVDVNREVKLM